MYNHNSSHQLYKKAMALVLSGGRGSRLYNLTDTIAQPAVYFGCKFSIIDYAL
ncbi:sugar phosphate nucleotidyltransferase, partial [Francisella tularensis subsp. holarctica]|uniref:sugar phosphate nucleotidyltransferase n=1 Tax=Francisella tularensis TaxID=263 RepID=UPI002381B5BD